MKIWSLFVKSMLEQIRDYKMLALIMLSPLFFITVFGMVFSSGFYTTAVAITNHDKGPLGAELIKLLKESKFGNDSYVFKITEGNLADEEVKKELSARTYAGHVRIPENFSQYIQDKNIRDTIPLTISGDPTFSFFFICQLTLEVYITDFLYTKVSERDPVQLKFNMIAQTGIMKSDFDAMAPGLIIISVFFLLIQASMVIAREVEHRTMQRLLLSKMQAWHLYAAVGLSQLVLAACMFPMVLPFSMIFNFHPHGSITLTFVVFLLSAFAAIALGMLTAAFSRTAMEAFVIGNVVLTPMFFLSGIFWPAPSPKLFTLGGYEVKVLSLVPSTPAVDAMNKVMLGNASFTGVLPEITILFVTSLIIFVAGVWIFNKRFVYSQQA